MDTSNGEVKAVADGVESVIDLSVSNDLSVGYDASRYENHPVRRKGDLLAGKKAIRPSGRRRHVCR